MDYEELIKAASEIKNRAYAPYSNFRVGAAVLTAGGRIFTGVNIENVSYGATNCAERTAIFKAVCEGELKIKAIAIASDKDGFIFPCGICRQVISEFGDADTQVICSGKNGDYEVYRLEELLPKAFTEYGGNV